MTRRRFLLTLNLILILSLIITSCAGAPTLPSLSTSEPTTTPISAITAAITAIQQTWTPALIETDPPVNTVIGHTTPITFYFNQSMNKQSVESAFSGLPQGAFTWSDESTLVFTPAQSYQPNSKLDITLADSVQ